MCNVPNQHKKFQLCRCCQHNMFFSDPLWPWTSTAVTKIGIKGVNFNRDVYAKFTRSLYLSNNKNSSCHRLLDGHRPLHIIACFSWRAAAPVFFCSTNFEAFFSFFKILYYSALNTTCTDKRANTPTHSDSPLPIFFFTLSTISCAAFTSLKFAP